MTRAVVYARVSTDEQGKGYSLGTQIEKCKQYAEEQGYTVIDVFQDTYTGTELSRPGLDQLYECIEAKAVDILIVYDVDRLSRKTGYQAMIEMRMEKAGVEIEYVLVGDIKSASRRLLKGIKAEIAQYENEQRLERCRRGKIGRIKRGYVICPAGRAPFGYTYKSEPHKGWLVINEQEAEVVRQIYTWLVRDGISSYAIAKRLWENHILTRGDYSDVVSKKTSRAEWSPVTVRRIIRNSTYKGAWHYGKTRMVMVNGKKKQVATPKSEWLEVKVLAIIDDDLWEQAQKQLDKNKQNSTRNSRRKYLLRGMVFCTCGRRWTGRYRNNVDRSYYRCPTTEAEHWRCNCTTRFSYRQDRLEPVVWDKVHAFLLDPQSLQVEIKRRRDRYGADIEQKESRLSSIEAALEENMRKMGMLLDQALTGGFPQSIIDDRKKELQHQREAFLNEQRNILNELAIGTIPPEQEQEMVSIMQEIGTELQHSDYDVRRRLLEMLQIRIDVIDREQFKLSGVISTDGSIVNLLSKTKLAGNV